MAFHDTESWQEARDLLLGIEDQCQAPLAALLSRIREGLDSSMTYRADIFEPARHTSTASNESSSEITGAQTPLSATTRPKSIMASSLQYTIDDAVQAVDAVLTQADVVSRCYRSVEAAQIRLLKHRAHRGWVAIRRAVQMKRKKNMLRQLLVFRRQQTAERVALLKMMERLSKHLDSRTKDSPKAQSIGFSPKDVTKDRQSSLELVPMKKCISSRRRKSTKVTIRDGSQNIVGDSSCSSESVSSNKLGPTSNTTSDLDKAFNKQNHGRTTWSIASVPSNRSSIAITSSNLFDQPTTGQSRVVVGRNTSELQKDANSIPRKESNPTGSSEIVQKKYSSHSPSPSQSQSHISRNAKEKDSLSTSGSPFSVYTLNSTKKKHTSRSQDQQSENVYTAACQESDDLKVDQGDYSLKPFENDDEMPYLAVKQTRELLLRTRDSLRKHDLKREAFVTLDVLEDRRRALASTEDEAEKAKSEAEELQAKAASLRTFLDQYQSSSEGQVARIGIDERASLLLRNISKFESLVTRDRIADAALLATTAPDGILRTQATWQRFMSMKGGTVWSVYCRMLLVHSPTDEEVVSCVQEAINRNALELTAHWFTAVWFCRKFDTYTC